MGPWDVAEFFLPLFPTGHGLLAVIIVYKGSLLVSLRICVNQFFTVMGLSVKGLDDNILVHLKSRGGNHCFSQRVIKDCSYDLL